MQVKMNDLWTIDDLGLFLRPGITIEAPKSKINRVEIPFGNGSIDLSEALTGEVSYSDRLITFELLFRQNIKNNWNIIYDVLIQNFHGKKTKLIMPQFPNYLYMGRTEIGALEVSRYYATVVVTSTVAPFRLKKELTTITKVVSNSGSLSLNLKNERMTTLPEFTISASSQILFGEGSYSHNSGTFTLANIALKQGDNPITIKAAAGTTVKITYQEGAL